MSLKDVLGAIKSTKSIRPSGPGRLRRHVDLRDPELDLAAETEWHCHHGHTTNVKTMHVLASAPGEWYTDHRCYNHECILVVHAEAVAKLVDQAQRCKRCRLWKCHLALVDGRCNSCQAYEGV